MVVVADTGPVNYLVLSGQIGLAHDLYQTLLIPGAVHRELLHARAPATVREWASTTNIFLADEIVQEALRRHSERQQNRGHS